MEAGNASELKSSRGFCNEQCERTKNQIDEVPKEWLDSLKWKRNAVPQLIENKRKHLGKQLSASQRDVILLSGSLEDLNIQKEVCDSIKDLSSSMSRSIELLAQSLAQPPQRKPR